MATYYVRPDGNNNNDGLGPGPDRAWATITKACSAPVAPGDTAYIAPGTYRELMNPGVSGTSGAWIQYLGDPTASQFPGMVSGQIRVTAWDDDAALPVRTNALLIQANYIKIVDILFDGAAGSSGAGGTVGLVNDCINYNKFQLTRCTFKGGKIGFQLNGFKAGLAQDSMVFDSCWFEGYDVAFYHKGPSGATYQNCDFRGGGTGWKLTNSVWGSDPCNRFIGCRIIGGLYGWYWDNFESNTPKPTIEGCYIKGDVAIFHSIAGSSSYLTTWPIRGCVIEGEQYGLQVNTHPTEMSGCIVKGRIAFGGSIFNGGGTVTGCKFIGLVQSSSAQTFQSCEFEGKGNDACINGSGSGTLTVRNSYLHDAGNLVSNRVDCGSSRLSRALAAFFYGSNYTNSPGNVYGPPPDPWDPPCGMALETVTPIAGGKSAKLIVSRVAIPYTWKFPADTGAFTVRLKARKNFTGGGALVKFKATGGDWVQMADDDQVQVIDVPGYMAQAGYAEIQVWAEEATYAAGHYVLIDDLEVL